MPADYDLAVELYIKPWTSPGRLGQEVCFILTAGLPLSFPGLLGQSFGTYSGSVVAIDNMISANGEYRILVGPAKKQAQKLPGRFRRQGIALLNNVPSGMRSGENQWVPAG